MTERAPIENAFGLRWLQDDDRGRLVYEPGNRDFKSPADAIEVLQLACEEAALAESLDRFPSHLRIHGGYTPFLGEPATRFTLTWEPGAAEAAFLQTLEGADGESMEGNVEVPAGGALKDVLRDLLVPDARDVVDLAREEGKAASMNDVDFWIGERHFRVSDEEAP
jgi:hypothetical protein